MPQGLHFAFGPQGLHFAFGPQGLHLSAPHGLHPAIFDPESVATKLVDTLIVSSTFPATMLGISTP